eukprot:Colp12_sorted_trinity150504_noHs@16192
MLDASPEIAAIVDHFVAELKRKHISSGYQAAHHTVLLLRSVVSNQRWANARDLMDKIKAVGCAISSAQPDETVINNMTRRVLNIIRQEYNALVHKKDEEDDAAPVLALSLRTSMVGEKQDDYERAVPNLKGQIIEAIKELLDELETTAEYISTLYISNIAGHAPTYVYRLLSDIYHPADYTL